MRVGSRPTLDATRMHMESERHARRAAWGSQRDENDRTRCDTARLGTCFGQQTALTVAHGLARHRLRYPILAAAFVLDVDHGLATLRTLRGPGKRDRHADRAQDQTGAESLVISVCSIHCMSPRLAQTHARPLVHPWRQMQTARE